MSVAGRLLLLFGKKMSVFRHNQQLSNYLASHKSGTHTGGHNTNNRLEPRTTDQMRTLQLHDSKSHAQQRHQTDASPRKSSAASGSSKSRGVNAVKGRSAIGSGRRRANVDDLPDEVLLKVFGFLPADSLVTCDCVCKRWHQLANDDSLWERLYRSYAASKSELAERRLQSAKSSDPKSSWKAKCIHKCIERRNARIKTLLSKSSPYTHLPANTDKAIQKLGIGWELVLRDNDKADHSFAQSDGYHLPTSSTVRWYHLQFPPIRSLRCLSIIAKAPVFFKKDGSAADNSPCQRSLLAQHDLHLGKLSTNHQPVAHDDLIDLRVIGQSILVASWKDGGELAFISASLHNHGLVHRCTQGSLNRPYIVPSHKPKPDDIDPQYGLHDYTCVVELRNQRSVLWGQQFKNVHCVKQQKEEGFARLTPVQPDVISDHSYASKKLQLPWKSDLFKGIVQDFCILDVTIHDEFLKPFWCLSCPVKVAKAVDSIVNYSYDGEAYVISHSGEKGSVKINLIWDHSKEQYAVTGVFLDISLEAINAWFSTNY
ncbi:F-box only protein 15-like isoform X2 [Patiria miniata]|uniref:F-box domain-containing protein n=1 Tax=Patiria miniata TaxID=46514 RepID=A0A914B346_PATMI|nr:F-box only protein 15-like isoform X2 [Patiria miniata]